VEASACAGGGGCLFIGASEAEGVCGRRLKGRARELRRHARWPMCTARRQREARPGGGCPAGTLVGAGACGSASPVGSERVKPNDGVGLRRTTVRRAEEAQTSMRRVATERDAPATRSGQSAASSFEFRIALV
jgi:hypothetical protein